MSFKLREPSVDTYKFSWKQFLKQNKLGFQELTNVKLRRFLPVFVSVAAGYYMWSTGIIRITMGGEFGYDGETLSYLIGVISFVASLFVFKFNQIKNVLGNKKGLVILSVLAMLGWMVAGYGGGLALGAVAFVLLYVSGQMHRPWVSSVMNQHTPSQLRATTISTMQFMIQIPYVLVVILYGLLIESGKTSLFYYVTAALIGLSLGASYLLAKKK